MFKNFTNFFDHRIFAFEVTNVISAKRNVHSHMRNHRHIRLYKDVVNFMEMEESIRFYAIDWYIDADSVPMHLTPPSSNAILSSRASILESQETRQLLRAFDKYHGTINVNLTKNDIIRIQLKIKRDKSVYKKGLETKINRLYIELFKIISNH